MNESTQVFPASSMIVLYASGYQAKEAVRILDIPVALENANYARYPAKTAELSHSSVTPQKLCQSCF